MVTLMRSAALMFLLAVLAGCGSQDAPQAPAAETGKGPALEASIRTLDTLWAATRRESGPPSGAGAAVARLYAWASGKAITPEGVPFGIFVMSPDTPPDSNVYFVCLPVPQGTRHDPSAQVMVRPVGGIELASTIHTGPYDRIGPVYEHLEQWVDEHDYVIFGPAFEFYLNNPTTTTPESLRTEVAFQVKPRVQ